MQTECETCHNQYDKPFQVLMGGEAHVFDSFECAIEALAPRCENCNCRVIGHGVEQSGTIYCCANCAAAKGSTPIRDRA